MAIEKEKTLNNGSVGNYWRILNITIDRQNMKAHAQLALFKDKATSDAGGHNLNCIKLFSFNFTTAELVAANTNLISWVYSKIMAAASTLVTKDIIGQTIPPTPYDQDIAGGINV